LFDRNNRRFWANSFFSLSFTFLYGNFKLS
jgi:hypothetical protein